MKPILVLGIIAVANVAGALEAGLKVRFDMGTSPADGETYFMPVPRTISAAKAEGWREARRPAGPMSQLVMYCPTDKVLCALYDDLDDVAGLQIAIPKQGISNNVFSWKKRGFRTWNTAVGGKCVTMYTIQQYFVNEEYLQRSKEERLAARDPSRVLHQNALWVTGIDGEVIRVSASEEDIKQEGLFTEQGCIPWMGNHYYYKMSNETPCDAENMHPWFPMTLNGELIASGFLTFGTLTIADKDWFERPAVEAVMAIVPYGPQCLYDLTASPGAVTMHIYYTDTPWLISC